MPNIAQQYAQSVIGKYGQNSQTVTPFTSVLPKSTIINEDLLNQFAQSQANPEINRLKWTGMYNQLANQAQQGGLRFGGAVAQQNALADQYERQRKELTQQFYGAGKSNLTNYYNDLMGEYYTDPNKFQYTPLQSNLANVIRSY